MASFKVGIKTHNNPQDWAYNALRFTDKKYAEIYGAGLRLRWRDVLAFEVHPSAEPPNCFYPVPSDRYNVPRGPAPANIDTALDDLAERGFAERDERKKK